MNTLGCLRGLSEDRRQDDVRGCRGPVEAVAIFGGRCHSWLPVFILGSPSAKYLIYGGRSRFFLAIARNGDITVDDLNLEQRATI